MNQTELAIIGVLLLGIFVMLCFIGFSMVVALRQRMSDLDGLERQLLDSYGWLIKMILAVLLGVGTVCAVIFPLALLARFIL
jgi:uncharacterized membrane protein